MNRPLIAVTMGDPAGVGPETIARAWSLRETHSICRPLVVGHPEILRSAVTLVNGDVRVVEVGSPGEVDSSPDTMPCLRAGSDEALLARPATIDARAGEAAYQAVLRATELALGGEVDAVTTAPLHKAALWKAGHRYPGHTELLAELCGVDDFAMMLYLPPGETVKGVGGLGVAHVTLHMALRDVFEHISEDAVLAKCGLADEMMRCFLDRRPRIALCALNPHAGEEGLFGDEERLILEPAARRARETGLDVDGPFPTDTLMGQARDGAWDAVVAMYHDQGHIALKLLGMHACVNVTLGLPIVRTSVAHGTAFDVAWQGRAEEGGLVEALRVASQLARRRETRPPTAATIHTS